MILALKTFFPVDEDVWEILLAAIAWFRTAVPVLALPMLGKHTVRKPANGDIMTYSLSFIDFNEKLKPAVLT